MFLHYHTTHDKNVISECLQVSGPIVHVMTVILTANCEVTEWTVS